MVRPLRSYSTSASVRSHPKERALKEGQSIRLRSGSAGQRPLPGKNEEEEDDGGEPIQVRIVKALISTYERFVIQFLYL